jgi:hypothetical protein
MSLTVRRDARCNGMDSRYFDFREFNLFHTSQKALVLAFSLMFWSLLRRPKPSTGKFHRIVVATPDLAETLILSQSRATSLQQHRQACAADGAYKSQIEFSRNDERSLFARGLRYEAISCNAATPLGTSNQ